mmetsp:Transcript_7259/g.23844  ORF Transcript_7259/g.23844 Transcript_7259/m.23844 type:complete len:273 (+) Transcript_7259:143-961(+)
MTARGGLPVTLSTVLKVRRVVLPGMTWRPYAASESGGDVVVHQVRVVRDGERQVRHGVRLDGGLAAGVRDRPDREGDVGDEASDFRGGGDHEPGVEGTGAAGGDAAADLHVGAADEEGKEPHDDGSVRVLAVDVADDHRPRDAAVGVPLVDRRTRAPRQGRRAPLLLPLCERGHADHRLRGLAGREVVPPHGRLPGRCDDAAGVDRKRRFPENHGPRRMLPHSSKKGPRGPGAASLLRRKEGRRLPGEACCRRLTGKHQDDARRRPRLPLEE